MRKNKATGIDKIPGELYKLVEREEKPESNLSKSLLNILNGVFENNAFPTEWKDVIVVPIPKKETFAIQIIIVE
ncbi:hypothetical protein GVAV_002479 [Gurleya vavrai]